MQLRRGRFCLRRFVTIAAMLDTHTIDGITTIRMAHGKASALDLELCNALTSAIA